MSTHERHLKGGATASTTTQIPPAGRPNEAVAVNGGSVDTEGAPRTPAILGRNPRARRLTKQTPATRKGDADMLKQRIAPQRITSDTMLLTFKEAMDFLRVSRSTLYRLMWSGQLRGHKVGSTWRFYESDLLAAVASPTHSTTVVDDLLTGKGLE